MGTAAGGYSRPVGSEDSGTQTIKAEEAREALAKNEAVAIDVRGDEDWRSGHIPAARHVAEEDFADLDDLPDDQKVIIVGSDDESSAAAAEKLGDDGREVVILAGGMDAWKSADLGMQPSTDPEEDVPI